MAKVQFTKFKSDAKIPTRDKGNAGFDIYPCFEEYCMEIKPHQTKLVPTGIGSIIPDTHYFQIYERGSTGSKGIKYGAGVIDPSYRGEWFLAVTNTNDKPLLIAKEEYLEKHTDSTLEEYIVYPYNKAIFQAVLHDLHDVEIEEISYTEFEQNKTKRGNGCLGSTRK